VGALSDTFLFCSMKLCFMKSLIKRVWHFVWDDNSPLSWVVNIALAFIIIKFLVYPGLGLALSTGSPVVAVVSCSMEHKFTDCGSGGGYKLCGESFVKAQNIGFDSYWRACGRWYEGMNITKDLFSQFSFSGGLGKGDLIILKGRKASDLNVGDVVVFNGNSNEPVIHRVVDKRMPDSSYVIGTKGDNNGVQIDYETSIQESRIVGKALFRIPFLGYVKIAFTNLLGAFR